MNFNERTEERGGKTYIFITRGKSNPITNEEVEDYFKNKTKPKTNIGIPDVLTSIFASDLKKGLDFCVKKYNLSREVLLSEAKRLVKGINLNNIRP